jgi:hypothetical protein
VGRKTFKAARDKAFTWLWNGPIQDMNWNGFYEDIGVHPKNRNNYDCIDTASYLVIHRAENKAFLPTALRLCDWVRRTFVDERHQYSPAPAVREQLVCDFRMAGHAGHWALLMGCLYDATGDAKYRVEMLNAASLITYHLQSDNRVTLGPEWKEGTGRYYWYSNSFSTMRDLITILGHCPEAAPGNETHILRYQVPVRDVMYRSTRVEYTTDATSLETLKMAFVPARITVNGKPVAPGNGVTDGWTFDPETHILRLAHPAGEVVVCP